MHINFFYLAKMTVSVIHIFVFNDFINKICYQTFHFHENFLCIDITMICLKNHIRGLGLDSIHGDPTIFLYAQNRVVTDCFQINAY